MKKLRLLILLQVMTLVTSIDSAQACRDVKIKSAQEMANDILRQTHVQEVENNTNEFCQRNMLLQEAGFEKNKPKDVEKLSIEDLKDQVEESLPRTSEWATSLIPSQSAREDSFLDVTDSMPQFAGAKDNLDGKAEAMQSYFSNKRDDIDRVARKKKILQAFDSAVKNPISAQLEPLMKFESCQELTTVDLPSCYKGLGVIKKTMMPVHLSKGSPSFDPVSLWKKVLTDDKYNEGLRIAAQTITGRLRNFSKGHNIFDDMTNAYVKAGFNPSEAKDMSVDVLGLIANGASNTEFRLKKLLGDDFSQKDNALSVIAAALPLLDYYQATISKGQLYSLPSSVKSTCDFGKTYHFWMEAYTAKNLVSENNLSSEGAASATFIQEKAYQIFRDQVGGNPTHSSNYISPAARVLTEPAFGPNHEVARMDLSFAAAGAEFGAHLQNPPTINVDHVIAKMEAEAKIYDPETAASAKQHNVLGLYTNWSWTISPNSALEAAKNSP